MAHKNGNCTYDKNHTIEVHGRDKDVEERNLNITIVNTIDVVQIKVRDPSDFSFNYTENIDLGDFEVMRVNQNLDINFNEFKYNLIEMLQQFQKNEMFLKCVVSNQKCTLVFYCKSKIKCIIYLTIDLHLTNQKEIFTELVNNMQNIQEKNERLKNQLSNTKKTLFEKDQEIQQLKNLKKELELQFLNNLKDVHNIFNTKMGEIETVLLNKLALNKKQLTKLHGDVTIIKKEICRKSEMNRDLIRSMENLQLDSKSNLAMINHLKKENSELHSTKFTQEKYIANLQKSLQEKDCAVADLQKKNSEMKSDLEKLTIAMTQKKATIDELSKDLVQANQMLVNFNNHYDSKSKQVDELQSAIIEKEAIIKEHKIRHNELLKEFEMYKASFNSEEQGKLKHELFLASNKIEELEGALRKANKINALLTEKVNSMNFGFQ